MGPDYSIPEPSASEIVYLGGNGVKNFVYGPICIVVGLALLALAVVVLGTNLAYSIAFGATAALLIGVGLIYAIKQERVYAHRHSRHVVVRSGRLGGEARWCSYPVDDVRLNGEMEWARASHLPVKVYSVVLGTPDGRQIKLVDRDSRRMARRVRSRIETHLMVVVDGESRQDGL